MVFVIAGQLTIFGMKYRGINEALREYHFCDDKIPENANVFSLDFSIKGRAGNETAEHLDSLFLNRMSFSLVERHGVPLGNWSANSPLHPIQYVDKMNPYKGIKGAPPIKNPSLEYLRFKKVKEALPVHAIHLWKADLLDQKEMLQEIEKDYTSFCVSENGNARLYLLRDKYE